MKVALIVMGVILLLAIVVVLLIMFGILAGGSPA